MWTGATAEGIVVCRSAVGINEFFRLSPDGNWYHGRARKPWVPIDETLVPKAVIEAAKNWRPMKSVDVR